jgi:hypothetical protein
MEFEPSRAARGVETTILLAVGATQKGTARSACRCVPKCMVQTGQQAYLTPTQRNFRITKVVSSNTIQNHSSSMHRLLQIGSCHRRADDGLYHDGCRELAYAITRLSRWYPALSCGAITMTSARPCRLWASHRRLYLCDNATSTFSCRGYRVPNLRWTVSHF